MTRVDFYILEDTGLDAAQRFACKLCAQVSKSLPIHIHTENSQQAEEIDELLWSYPLHRFLPHKIIPAANDDIACGIHIGWQAPEFEHGALINLASEVPSFFGRFDRVLEIIVGESKDAGRQRFKHYRERGYPLFDHHLTDWEKAS